MYLDPNVIWLAILFSCTLFCLHFSIKTLQQPWSRPSLLFFLYLHKWGTIIIYSKSCVKLPFSKWPQISFQDQLSLNAGQKYCRMLQGEHSAILLTFIKQLFVIKIFVLSIFEWPLYTGFTVIPVLAGNLCKLLVPSSGQTERQAWSGSKLLDILMVFTLEFFENIILKIKSADNKNS